MAALAFNTWLGAGRENLPRPELEQLMGRSLPEGELRSYFYRGLLLVKVKAPSARLKVWCEQELPSVEAELRPPLMDFKLDRPWWGAPAEKSILGHSGDYEAMLTADGLYLARRKIESTGESQL